LIFDPHIARSFPNRGKIEIRVKLFGTLSKGFPGYQSETGIEVEIPDGARVRDLLARLEISRSQSGVVSMEGRILRADGKLKEGAIVQVFQAVHGG
jgi:sulfur carrier protein ThiS